MPKVKHIPTIYLLLALTTLTAYWPVGNHEFVHFDDNIYITENKDVQNGITVQGLYWAFTTGHAANWHPLTWLSHMLDIQIFGLNPHWHHLTNLLLHIANVLLLFFVLHRMTKAPWQSALVAALFALHPLHVESVAWISERKDVLSTFFWMLTLVAYNRYAARPRLGNYLVVIVFFALGLMAKPMLVTLPFVLLLLDYWPLERFGKIESVTPARTQITSPLPGRGRKAKTGKGTPKMRTEVEKPLTRKLQWASARPLILEKVPLLALTILSCVATFTAQSKSGAVASLEIFSPEERIANALVSYAGYIIKTIWPDNLAAYYPHLRAWPFWQAPGTVLFLAAVTLAVIVRAKKFPYLPVGWLWFTGTLVPVLGVVQVGSQAMADRYTYIPSIGLFIMAAWGIPQIFQNRRHGKEVLVASSALCLLCLITLTRIQVGYWHDNLTLFGHTLEATENNYFIYTIRGGIFYDMGDYNHAIDDLDRAIQINPGFALAYNGRGNVRDTLGYCAQAIEDYSRAVEIQPRYPEAYYNRGTSYQNAGMYRQAIQDYDKAIETNLLDTADVFCNRGAAYASLGDQMKAIEDYGRALEIDPRHAKTYFNRAIAYGILGDHLQALKDFDSAIQINPEYARAYFHRGKAHALLGDQKQALEDMKTAARLGYEDAGELLKSQGVNW